MPAKSKSQQKFMGMVRAYQKGELKNASKQVKDVAKSIDKEDAEDYASTKHKNLPNKVKQEAIQMNTKDILNNPKLKTILKKLNIKTAKSLNDVVKVMNYFINNPAALTTLKHAMGEGKSLNEGMSNTIRSLRRSNYDTVFGKFDEMFESEDYCDGISHNEIRGLLRSKTWTRFAGNNKKLRRAWKEYCHKDTGKICKEDGVWKRINTKPVNEGLSRRGYIEILGQAKYLKIGVMELLKSLKRQDDKVDDDVHYVHAKTKLMMDLLKRFNESIDESKLNEKDDSKLRRDVMRSFTDTMKNLIQLQRANPSDVNKKKLKSSMGTLAKLHSLLRKELLG